MSVEVKWEDSDPQTGQRRFITVQKFAGRWQFSVRHSRRGESRPIQPTREMLEVLLDRLQRRYQRREGVSDLELQQVRTLLAHYRDPPQLERTRPMPLLAQLATLGFVLSADGQRVLLIHRNRRPDDPHWGKYNGLGGKLEAGEDVVAGLTREIREEAGIECLSLRLRGTVSWPGFGRNGENWFGFIFIVDSWQGTPLTANAEGELVWCELADVLAGRLPMWEGDRLFLPLVFGPREQTFHGVMPYANGRPIGWSYSLLPTTSPPSDQPPRDQPPRDQPPRDQPPRPATPATD
jgi:8-oxo-dGTP diphosphatase